MLLRHPDPLAKFLTTATTFLFYSGLVGAALVLIAMPAMKFADAENQEWYWGIPVSAVASYPETRVATRWEGTVLRVEDVQGTLRLPLGRSRGRSSRCCGSTRP